MMRKPFKILIVALFLPLLLLSCKGKEEPEPLKPLKPAKPAEAPLPAPTADVTAGIEPTAPQRNPFLSYILLMKGRETVQKIKGPLECCELGLFKLIAVVESHDSAFALVQTPDNKRYVVRLGDLIGAREGKIVKIAKRSLTVREVTRDENGQIASTMDVELKIPEKEEERPR